MCDSCCLFLSFLERTCGRIWERKAKPEMRFQKMKFHAFSEQCPHAFTLNFKKKFYYFWFQQLVIKYKIYVPYFLLSSYSTIHLFSQLWVALFLVFLSPVTVPHVWADMCCLCCSIGGLSLETLLCSPQPWFQAEPLLVFKRNPEITMAQKCKLPFITGRY